MPAARSSGWSPPVESIVTSLRRVEIDELPTAWATLTASFDDDPMFRWLLPDDRERAEWVAVAMAFGIHHGLPEDGVLCPEAGPEAGVIVLVPPGRFPTPHGRTFGFVVRRFPRPDLPLPSRHFLRGGLACLSAMQRLHLHDPHWYVFILGVNPARQGEGFGRVLMNEVCARAERDGVAAYLETTNPVNLGFYGRFGFEVVEEMHPLPEAPPLWTMRRPPPE